MTDIIQYFLIAGLIGAFLGQREWYKKRCDEFSDQIRDLSQRFNRHILTRISRHAKPGVCGCMRESENEPSKNS